MYIYRADGSRLSPCLISQLSICVSVLNSSDIVLRLSPIVDHRDPFSSVLLLLLLLLSSESGVQRADGGILLEARLRNAGEIALL